MKQLEVLEYLKLNGWQKFLYNLKCFFCSIPGKFSRLGKKIWNAIKWFGLAIWNNLKDLWLTFKNGKWQTKLSYLIMGFGSFWYGQAGRGIMFFLLEAVFIVYMVLMGGNYLGDFISLGDLEQQEVYDPDLDVYVPVAGDSSFRILLYSLLTIFFIIAIIYTWRLQIKQCRINEEILASGKKVKGTKDDMKSLLDEQFHKTLLAVPVIGILIFTVLPIVFMILAAFTDYDKNHNGFANLFNWDLGAWGKLVQFNVEGSTSMSFSLTFADVLLWTLVWAFFATFTNYFLGMFVAMMINKKGIRGKKIFRTILVMTIAIPQFISLMYVSKLFADNGIVNGLLKSWGWIKEPIRFWGAPGNYNLARAMVILVNIWIGIPYLMLMATGILMNIPADLYESAKIDGASGWKQFTKITLPYMLFVTGPYLLTSFTGNINNFNVIFLLTGGSPTKIDGSPMAGDIGETDLLITWLFKLTKDRGDYSLASVIGIMIFLVVSIISLIVYNLLPSNRNEGDFS